MTSKYLSWPLLTLALLLSAPALAQTAPGWGWVRDFNDYTSSTQLGSENRTAGVGRDAAGNLYVAGAYIGSLTVGSPPPGTVGNQANSEVFLTKYDPAGTLLWVKALHGTDIDAATQLVVTPSGLCIMAGTYGQGQTGGNLLFTDFGSSLVLPGPAQVGLAGGTTSLYQKLPFLAAVNSNGSLAWATCPTATYGFTPQSLACDDQGNAYLSATISQAMVVNGTTYPRVGTSDAVLLKFGTSGQVQWVQQANAATAQVNGLGIKADQTGNVYWLVDHSKPFSFNNTTVGTGAGSTLIKIAGATNQVQWVKSDLVQIGSTPLAGSGISGLDNATGSLYIYLISAGQSITYPGASAPVVVTSSKNAVTFCIARCDLNGQVTWVKPLVITTPTNSSSSYLIAAPQVYPTATGFVALTSTVYRGITLFAGSAVTYPDSEGGQVCVLHYNTSTDQTEWVRTAGTVLGGFQAGSRVGTTAAGATLDAAGNVYVAGLYYGPAQFGSTTLPSTNGTYHTFLAKLDQTVLATKAAAVAGRAWQPYPNPASGTVHLGGLPPRAQVQLLDARGRPVRQTSAADLNLAGLAAGLYLLQVSNTAEPYQSQRLTVE